MFQAEGTFGYTPAGDVPRWTQFFHERLAAAKSRTRFLIAWSGAVALRDTDALPIAGQKLNTVGLIEADQLSVACAAFTFDTPAWAQFQQAAQPWSALPAKVQTYLSSPAPCGAPN